MADGTKIEWTDATWNPITGCSVVSPGCTNCYAMKLAGTRLKNHPSRMGLTKETKAGPVWTGEVRFNAEWLDQPLRWTKPRMIFVCAHGDLFAEGVPDEWIDQVFAVMALCPQHTFQVLTKRPERMREYLLGFGCDGARRFNISNSAERIATHFRNWRGDGSTNWDVAVAQAITGPLWPLPNVWLGVSVEDQRRADERIPILLDTPAAIRWISAEPLLGPMDLFSSKGGTLWIGGQRGCSGRHQHNGRPGEIIHGVTHNGDPRQPHHHHDERCAHGLDWVVAGGESGPGARPMHPDWARSLRDQCATAGVPFLFKQWGEFGPAFGKHLLPTGLPWSGEAQRAVAHGTATVEQATRRLGKRRAGRLLDGVEHNGYPEPRHA